MGDEIYGNNSGCLHELRKLQRTPPVSNRWSVLSASVAASMGKPTNAAVMEFACATRGWLCSMISVNVQVLPRGSAVFDVRDAVVISSTA